MINPFFSVIITCYNYEKYVSHAIQSACNQFFSSFEVIVVDAGSTDNSRRIIESFKNILITEAPSGSHSIACQAGFLLARGNWIIFLDADDFLFPNALEEIASHANPTYSKVQYNLRICDAHGTLSNRKAVTYPHKYNAIHASSSFFLNGTYIWPVTTGNAFSSGFLQKALPLNITLPPDGQLNTLAPSFGLVHTINKPLGAYRLHGSNLDNQQSNSWTPSRFQKNIRRRYKEYFWANKKARISNKVFHRSNILNYEITFISYRIFCRKLDYKYLGFNNEDLPTLYYFLVRFLIKNKYPAGISISHLFWHLFFIFSPPFLAKKLLFLRFSRK